MSKIEIIAEIGENHMGKKELMDAMVLFAASNGATTVKFQSYNAACIREEDPERDWLLKVVLSDEDHFRLKKLAEDSGVKFLSSPFSKERATFLVRDLGLRELKIASCMMFNTDFLKHIARMGLDTIYISTGLASYVDILDAMHFLYGMAGKLVVMHCVSLYPCPLDKANLSRIRMLQDFTRCAVGYSDHTIGIGAAVASVAVGARVIEKHFTLDKNFSEGTDHILSVDPLGLRVMCNKVKSMEKMLGTVTSMHDTIEDIPKIEWLKNRFII